MRDPVESRPLHRILTAAAGLLLLVAAGAALWLGEGGLLPRVGFAALAAVVGIEAIVGAWQGRTSWISRLGPLP